MTRRSTWHEFSKLRRRLGNRSYDRVIDTQGLVKSAWIARLARGEHIGFSRQTAREPMAARFYETTFHVPENRHAVERNRMLIALALNLKIHTPIDYGLSRVRERCDPQSAKPYAVLLHGTARQEKEWPEGDWQELGRFIEAQGLQVVLPWGSEREESRSKRLAECMTNATVPPRHSINDVAALLAAARFVVGVDTGLLHLGVALGVPTVAIFKGSDPILTGPVGAGRIAICGSRGQTPTVQEVIAAVGKICSQ
jgi:heptosyltransferase-1